MGYWRMRALWEVAPKKFLNETCTTDTIQKCEEFQTFMHNNKNIKIVKNPLYHTNTTGTEIMQGQPLLTLKSYNCNGYWT